MNNVSIRYRGEDQVSTRGLPCGVPGLAVVMMAEGPALVHVRSGCGVAWFPGDDGEVALGGAAALAPLTDWTMPADYIFAKVSADDVLDAVLPFGGELGILEAGPEQRADIGG